MFGNKTKAEEIEQAGDRTELRSRMARQMERIVMIEEALNDATRLLAKKHGLALTEPYFCGPYLVRLVTRTKTKHVKS